MTTNYGFVRWLLGYLCGCFSMLAVCNHAEPIWPFLAGLAIVAFFVDCLFDTKSIQPR